MATTLYTHGIKYTWTGPGTSSLSGVSTVTGDGDDGRIVQVPASTTNLECDVALDASALKSVYMLSAQTVTLKTNSTSDPDDTITLTGGVPIVYQTGAGQTNPFTVDVTKIYITNATLVATQVDLRFLTDSTP